MSTEPHPTAPTEESKDWAEENRDWLEDVADSNSPAAWVAENVVQSLPEEGDS